jgi:uncharacterized protein YraI
MATLSLLAAVATAACGGDTTASASDLPGTSGVVSSPPPTETRYTTTTLTLRVEPSPTGSYVTTMPAGSAVQVGQCSYGGGKWCDVVSGYYTGYAASRYLTTDPTTAARQQLTAVQPSSAPRSTPRRRSSAPRYRALRSEAPVAPRAQSGYFVGPRGGCYTYSASGRKRYVDHSYCGR